MIRKKSKTVKVSFTLDQLDEMRKKLWDKINSIDFDGFASVDEDGCELQMEFTLEEKDGELKVKDRDYHGVWYTYSGSDYEEF